MPIKPQQVLKALKQAGFQERRQSGSHLIVSHGDGRYVVLPMHRKDLGKGLLQKILKQSGLSMSEIRKA